MRVLFYVQHLLGVGHVFRAMRIVRALGRKGIDIDLIYGGEPVPNLDAGNATVHHLPPLRAGAKEFHLLERPDGSVADEAYKNRRRDMVLDIFRETKPDAIVTEAFPFGRRQMRFELLPLLEAATAADPKPLIMCSVRDILQERTKPGRNEETAKYIERYFDRVIVHGDPNMVELKQTFPLADSFSMKTQYTGIVAPDPLDLVNRENTFDVIVSVGGGMLGKQLIEAAAKAKPLSTMIEKKWLFTLGPNANAADCSAIQKLAGGDVTAVSFVDDLTSLMASAELSISRCGYNTVADLFVSRCRGIVAPLDDGKETEQLTRAKILEDRGLATVLWPHEVYPEAIASKIGEAIERPASGQGQIALDGADKSAALISEWLAER